MPQTTTNQWSILNSIQDDRLDAWIEAFLFDRKAQNMSKGTIYFYVQKLALFSKYCDSQQISKISQISPNLIRQYLLYLEDTGHNPGGIHACFRTMKTFLLWWENEVEPEGWKNPIRKVKPPKVGSDPLEPADTEVIIAILDGCPSNTQLGLRDRAIILTLMDTGLRASELLNLDLTDINLITGEMLIRQGKGRKPRCVFVGSKTRKSIRRYLATRKDNSPALWLTSRMDRLTYWGLKSMMKNRASRAKVKTPSIHSFRRWFAITCLRAGTNVYSIQELMGHTDLQVLKRYLKQTKYDLKADHISSNLVDKFL